jgi:hypothetical protein
MSFSRTTYDKCAYQQQQTSSVGVGRYMLEMPRNDCGVPCFPNDPSIRVQRHGGAMCKPELLVDVDSDMLSIGRRFTKCRESIPAPGSTSCKPIFRGTKDCAFLHTESTLLSNPPCTLRSTGWNRWEWLPRDPQASAIEPFANPANSAMIAKDNHRPQLTVPIDQTLAMPRPAHAPAPKESYVWSEGVPAYVPPPHWRSCCEVALL